MPTFEVGVRRKIAAGLVMKSPSGRMLDMPNLLRWDCFIPSAIGIPERKSQEYDNMFSI
jgi:hypothetical protein